MSIEQDKGGGPAFPRAPVPPTADHGGACGDTGMTLRDYFAGQAVTGFIAAIKDVQEDPLFENASRGFAALSYIVADAMLKARENEMD